MSLTIPTQSSSFRIGGYVMIYQYPCKIISMSTCKTGKHGSAKVHFIGTDIFTEQKHDYLDSKGAGYTENFDFSIT